MNLREYVFSQPFLGWLLTGAMWTLIITALTTAFSLFLGIPVGMIRCSRFWGARFAARLFITVFRNMPLVPFLLFVVFALPEALAETTGLLLPRGMEFSLLILCVSLNNAGHVAEIFRSGLRAVPEAQAEAARVLGMSTWQIRLAVLYPQALRVSIPALGARLIHNMKNSSVAVLLPLSVDRMELTGQVSRIAGQTFAWTEPLLFAGLTYLALSLLLAKAVQLSSTRTGRKVVADVDY